MVSPGVMVAGGVALAVIAAAWIYSRGGVKNAAQSFGSAVGSGVVGAADGLIGGGVQGIGELFGVPRTDTPAGVSKCAAAKASGDTWAASQNCPAGDFLGWWWSK